MEGGRGEKMAALPRECSPGSPLAIGEPRGASLMTPAAEATYRQRRHCARGKSSMDAVAQRKASHASWRVAAGSWNRLRSWSEKHTHLQMCTTAEEILAQVGDAPERRAIPTALVESGYGRKHKVFCPRIVTNITTYNVRTLKAKWRQQELVGFLEKKRIDVCAIQEHRICHFNSSSPSSYTRVLHLPGGWRLVTHTADESASGGIGFLVSSIAFKCLGWSRIQIK